MLLFADPWSHLVGCWAFDVGQAVWKRTFLMGDIPVATASSQLEWGMPQTLPWPKLGVP